MTFTFPHLMEYFWRCETSTSAPFFMTQVPDFKSFVQGHLCDGQDSLDGHLKPLHFCFYVQGKLPIMQYKVHPKFFVWMPRESKIELWKKDDQRKPKLPPICTNVVPIANYVRDNTRDKSISWFLKKTYCIKRKGPWFFQIHGANYSLLEKHD